MRDDAPQRQVVPGLVFAAITVGLFVAANLLAAGDRNSAAIFCLVSAVIALAAAILALLPRFGRAVYKLLIEMLPWWS